MGRIPDAMGPCGIFCGACPSFGRTCLGCGSDDHNQRRSSKWSCRLRVCCFDDRHLDTCADCADFPCRRYVRKLPGSHPGDPRFKYRSDAVDNIARVREAGVDTMLAEEDRRWRCPECGGRVVFWRYSCSECGRSVAPEELGGPTER